MTMPMGERRERTIDGHVYIRICKSADVREGKGFVVDYDLDHEIALFRINGELRAVSNSCPHKRASMIAQGHVENDTVRCPMHGWTFRLRDGCFVGIFGRHTPAVSGRQRLDVYTVVEVDDAIWLLEPEERVVSWMV